MEHIADRLIRMYSKDGISVRFDWNYEDGFFFKPVARGFRWSWMPNKVTHLVTCELCGFTSTPKKVSYRSEIYGWNRENNKDVETPATCTLCTGCWNKVKVVVKKIKAANECEKLLNYLKRSIRDERRSRRAV